MTALRIGHGYDIHRTAAGRPLVLGGVKFDAAFGLDGHSDADALTHAICDALLGAAGLPDIGHQFPNTDPAFDTRKAVLEITQHVIQEAARTGNVVIVGRGGAYILRDFPGALHAFLRAATDVRVKAIMARYNIGSEEEARKRLKRTDENWTAYIKQVYGHDRNLAAHYDLVLDTGRLGYKGTVATIIAALRSRD